MMSMIADFQRLMCPEDDEDTLAGSTRPREAAVPESEAEFVARHQRAQSALVMELIGRIHAQSPAFFEYLVIDVLVAMGYGDRRRDLAQRLGRTGDGGIDGLISRDELGLDVIYVQAKRLRPGTVVPVSEVRDFVGSLDARQAGKGIFFSTSHFSPGGIEFCNRVSRRVVLVDGERLAQLMVRHNVGVKVKESLQIKRIDLDYFASASLARMQETISSPLRPHG